MKRKILVTVVSTLMSLSTVHAGSMGPVTSELSSSWIPFATLEGSYTWNQFDGYTINHLSTTETNQGWGGRFGAGIEHSVSEMVSLTGEMGGGYYGSTNPSIPADSYSGHFTIDGYDLLVGAAYKINQFDLFGKVGFMIENQRIKLSENLALTDPGGLISGTITKRYNQTQVLPEIKVGGIYNLNDKWGLSLAYMHVFGANMKSNITQTAAAGSMTTNGESNLQNPTLNSVMLGLRYNFA